MLGTFFYLPWIILLIKTQSFDDIKEGITNNPPVSDSNEKVSVNPSISDPTNQFENGPTILSDPSKPLFKISDKRTYIPSLFNVLFRLLNDDFFDSLKGKKDELAVNMLKLREEASNGQKDQESVNKSIKNLEEVLRKKYNIRIYSVYHFFEYFLKYIVDSNLDQDNKYFGVKLKDETAVFDADRASNNRLLPMFENYNLKINRDHMSFKSKFKWVFTKKPKLIFIYRPDGYSFDKNRKEHLKIQHEDVTDKSITIYNLKGIVFLDKNLKFNSFFIHNDEFYDQRTGVEKSITTAEIYVSELLIYELKEQTSFEYQIHFLNICLFIFFQMNTFFIKFTFLFFCCFMIVL
ncbi:hypothetical protein M153_11600016205 [Pseudoloma neurophilia]|uniref:Uncharacterized protein n=1 Tax=Pseudoloma neurophilia TaxID=146866 RepID=A0A0R0M723_9MICR|nr:hypothetical protein M153_11600016205 [Pseudoloma neurophilia]